MWPFRFDGNGGVAACPPGYAVARPAFAAVRFLVGEVDWRRCGLGRKHGVRPVLHRNRQMMGIRARSILKIKHLACAPVDLSGVASIARP
jgi:hypothetical protein